MFQWPSLTRIPFEWADWAGEGASVFAGDVEFVAADWVVEAPQHQPTLLPGLGNVRILPRVVIAKGCLRENVLQSLVKN